MAEGTRIGRRRVTRVRPWFRLAPWLVARLPLRASADVSTRFRDSRMRWGYAAAYERKLYR